MTCLMGMAKKCGKGIRNIQVILKKGLKKDWAALKRKNNFSTQAVLEAMKCKEMEEWTLRTANSIQASGKIASISERGSISGLINPPTMVIFKRD